MNFDLAFDRLMIHEGFYSDNPSDPGGKTTWGVTEDVARANHYIGPMRDLPQIFAKNIYRASYWTPINADLLPDACRYDVFDGAVNSGVKQSIKWLQRAVGVQDDGILGQVTINAANNMPGTTIAARYNGHRLELMTNLPTWLDFGRGWAKRIASNLKATP